MIFNEPPIILYAKDVSASNKRIKVTESSTDALMNDWFCEFSHHTISKESKPGINHGNKFQ